MEERARLFPGVAAPWSQAGRTQNLSVSVPLSVWAQLNRMDTSRAGSAGALFTASSPAWQQPGQVSSTALGVLTARSLCDNVVVITSRFLQCISNAGFSPALCV